MVNYPYQNRQLPIRERVEDLLSRMTIEEKIGQINQHLYGWECYEKKETGFDLTKKFKEHVEWGGGLGALYGLFRADPWSKVNVENGIAAEDSWKIANKVQEYVMNQSRWGIPALLVEECPHGHQGLDGISYPTNIGRGNSFNTELIRRSSRSMAKELAAKGVHIGLVSTLDLVKDPRWGRAEECFGEDPLLAAKMSRAVIAGFQGELINEDQKFLDLTVDEVNREEGTIGVVLKHCIAQGEAQGGHNSGTVTIAGREFQDVYVPLIESTKNALGVMAAYNDLDGVPCHANQYLLDELLRNQVGFQGIVMADGVALDRLEDVYETSAARADAALQAGVDLSLWDQTYTKISGAVHQGEIEESLVDQACARILSVKFLLGLFEKPFVDDPTEKLAEINKEGNQLNEAVAQESMTLVKNEGILPLAADYEGKIAVIGPNADKFYHLLGDYTAPQKEEKMNQTIFRELQRKYTKAEFLYAEGCEVRNTENQSMKIIEAVETAKKADVILLALGGSSARNFNMEFLENGAVSSKGINMDSGENVDVASLQLGGCQLELLNALAELKKPLISIMIQGRSYDIREVVDRSDAVLISWFPGQQGGKAVADILSGAVNPSGKLSVSYPRNSQQLPVYYYQRAASKQEHYYDELGSPLFPFGYGLSYTRFNYSELVVSTESEEVVVSVNVANHGKYEGKEAVLLFVKYQGGHVIQRKKILKEFTKLSLQPEESHKVVFRIPQKELSFTDTNNQQVQATSCTFEIEELSEKIFLDAREQHLILH